MVTPHPDIQRKFNNTKNIVDANKSQYVPGLFEKYPWDYIDLNTNNKLVSIKPWIEFSQKNLQYLQPLQTPIQPPIVDKILILCVDFNDKPATLQPSTIYNRFFSVTGNSFMNYYKEVSYTQYIPVGEVHGWYRAPHDSTWYTAGDFGFGSYPNDVRKLVEDTIVLASTDPSINWTSFDTNGNGYLDSVFVVHSGAEAAATGNVNDFWAHVWSVVNPKVIQGKTISTYALSAEYIYSSSGPQVSGVDSHEFGHILGLPDLYDYSGNSSGVGDYSIMGSGSWANSGMTPTHFDAWSKYKLGYSSIIIDPREITLLKDAETNIYNIQYTTLDPKEFFMVENRQAKLFDTYLPANGLLIWHINENQPDNSNKSCYLVGLIQADGLKDLENRINNGDGGDSYPGTTNNRSFGSNTNPISSLCNGSIKDMLMYNISDSADTMNFTSSLPTSVGSIKFVVYPPGADIYFDSIYQGTTDNITGEITIGNIPVGIVNYTIKKTGYYDRVGQTTVIENTIVQVSAILNISPLTGSLYITSEPTGAEIFVDDIDTVNTTPYTIPNLSSGSHTYKLTLTGYQNKSGSFDITVGQTTTVDAGTLQVQIAQAGFGSPVGIVLITGLLVGTIYSSVINKPPKQPNKIIG